MFNITRGDGDNVQLEGRLDAVSAPVARAFLAEIDSSCRIDFSRLEYIASAGLGVLVGVQRRLKENGEGLTLAGLSPHLREVMALAGFEGVFEFE